MAPHHQARQIARPASRSSPKPEAMLPNTICGTDHPVAQLPELATQFLELAKANERITSGQVFDLTGANRIAVKPHILVMVYTCHLVQRGSGNATW
jgi:hypothetical protein